MKGFLDSQTIDIPCDKCGHKTTRTIGWIKANKQFTCTCGTVIELDADHFIGEIKRAEAAFAKFKRDLDKL